MSPGGGKLPDPLLAELLHVLQQKVAQGTVRRAIKCMRACSGVPASGTDPLTGCAAPGVRADEEAASPCEQEDDGTDDDGSEAESGSADGSADGDEDCSNSTTAVTRTAEPAQQASQAASSSSSCQEDDTMLQGGSQQHAEQQPRLVGIQLASASCSLSHGLRAHMRQQLAAGLDVQKQVAAMKALVEGDPLLAMSL